MIEKVKCFYRSITRGFNRKHDAFTLLEMLIVLTIMGILMAVGMAAYTNVIATTKKKAAQTEMGQLKIGVMSYRMANNTLPASVEDLVKDGDVNTDAATDPWNVKYKLSFKTQGSFTTMIITSAGPDKKFGTADDITKEMRL